jgi:hypothetical protein
MFKVLLAVFIAATIASVQSAPAESSVECTSCSMAVKMIQSYVLTNATEEEILNKLDAEVCQPLGELSQLCTQYINDYVIKNYQTLVTMVVYTIFFQIKRIRFLTASTHTRTHLLCAV